MSLSLVGFSPQSPTGLGGFLPTSCQQSFGFSPQSPTGLGGFLLIDLVLLSASLRG